MTATAGTGKPYDPPDAIKLLLGEMVLAFGCLEFVLDVTFKRLIQHKDPTKNYHDAMVMAFEMTSRVRLSREIKSMYELIVMNQAHEATMDVALLNIDLCYGIRNDFVHGFWSVDTATSTPGIQVERDGDLALVPIPDEDYMRKFVGAVWDAARDFDAQTNPRNPARTLKAT